MNAAVPPLPLADRASVLPAIRKCLAEERLVPFLGAGIAALSAPVVPTDYDALAAALGKRVALPKRARGNPWASAQYIESSRHRSSLDALLREIFAAPVAPGPLHRFLAGLHLPLIVDSWYDGAMRAAMEDVLDWGEIQGITRAGIGEDRWFRAYDRKGAETPVVNAGGWATLLYKPHGAIAPVGNFLLADSDYVEVLTEIDIQNPIPDAVKLRRQGRGFLFLGCRFHDQLLRTYARQIMKRSRGPHFVVMGDTELTRNEIRFLRGQGITPIGGSLADFVSELVA
ncbi:SIR2 family NAD-dependent protein deacylase [Zavarzinia aquatilis]|uniref:SIR2 family protein n=1 Tax=Zavarzinia aquatilis TaxID=2211142 RepID=A0A317EFW1_9PROT|nr:SIR2 family protein [Zavarzinia aquatilis]PWR25186.1 SIR2 family protein [Zavarzinia aquatilis]